MFCSNCGQENRDNAKYCIKCGKPLLKAAVPKAIPKKRKGLGAVILLLLVAGSVTAFLCWRISPYADKAGNRDTTEERLESGESDLKQRQEDRTGETKESPDSTVAEPRPTAENETLQTSGETKNQFDSERYSFQLTLSPDECDEEHTFREKEVEYYKDDNTEYTYGLQLYDSLSDSLETLITVTIASPSYWVPSEEECMIAGNQNDACLFYIWCGEGELRGFLYTVSTNKLVQLESGYEYCIKDNSLIGYWNGFAVDDEKDLIWYSWDGIPVCRWDNTPFKFRDDWLYYAVSSQNADGIYRYDIHRCRYDRSKDEFLFYVETGKSSGVWFDGDTISWYTNNVVGNIVIKSVLIDEMKNVDYKGPESVSDQADMPTEEDDILMEQLKNYLIKYYPELGTRYVVFGQDYEGLLSCALVQDDDLVLFHAEINKETREVGIYNIDLRMIRNFILPE